MKRLALFLLFSVIHLMTFSQNSDNLIIRKTDDFTVSGDGTSPSWGKTDWIVIPPRTGTAPADTKVKILYSGKGIYFLFSCTDSRLTSTMNADFLDLWTEDVAEVFLWTDESSPVYFEYEISPLNFELPLLISNDNGELLRWQPFHYEANRRTAHETAVTGGEKKSMASVKGWTAEFFIPFKLLKPLNNNVPVSGTKWRANMYRVDYDDNKTTSWAWQPVNRTFHDYKKFGTIVFE